MKKTFILILMTVTMIGNGYAQDCEQIVANCEKLLRSGAEGSKFLSDGQVYSAFLDREEKAEFKTTFFGGSTYRIAVSAGSSDNFAIFTLRDVDGNILYSNRNYKNAPYWDFVVNETIEVSIVTELDLDLKASGSGCSIMLIGFKK